MQNTDSGSHAALSSARASMLELIDIEYSFEIEWC